MTKWIQATAYMISGRLAQRRPMPDRFTVDETNDFLGIRLLERGGNGRFIFSKIEKGGMKGRWYAGNNADPVERFIPKEDLPSYDFQGEEFYHGYSGRAENPYSFIFGNTVGLSWYYEKWDTWTQGRFNKRELTRQDRMQVLRLFVSKTSEDTDFEVSILGLMEILYTRRSFRHPHQETTNNYYELLLRSLVDSGDLSNHGNNGVAYALAPQGLTTLASYELEERRHHDNLKQQGRIGKLTGVLILIGLLQAWATYYAPGGAAVTTTPVVASPAP